MRVGIATNHGGLGPKEELLDQLHAAGHEVVDFGTHSLAEGDDDPDYVLPLAHAVVAGKVERGIAACAKRVPGVRAALIHDHFSAKQGVEDDRMNILCLGGCTVGPCVAWDLVQAFLQAKYSQESRPLRRLAKVVSAEREGRGNFRAAESSRLV